MLADTNGSSWQPPTYFPSMNLKPSFAGPTTWSQQKHQRKKPRASKPDAASSKHLSPCAPPCPWGLALLGALRVSAVNPFDSPQPPRLASYFRPLSSAFNIVL